MLELVGQDPGRTQGWQLGYAGDTFNTALYLSRLTSSVQVVVVGE